MTRQQLVICRGGPARYDGTTAYVPTEEDPQLYFEPDAEFGRPGAVYARTDRTEETPHGTAVVFEYIAADIPGA